MARLRAVEACERDLSWVAVHMRAEDRREVYPLRDYSDPVSLSLELMMTPGIRMCALEGGQPIAAWGAAHVTSFYWAAWAFGTDRFRRAVPLISWHIREVIFDVAWETGVQRVEIRTISDHDIAHRWLESLGCVRECDLPSLGRDGQCYTQYAWRRSDYRRKEDWYVPHEQPEDAQGSAAAA